MTRTAQDREMHALDPVPLNYSDFARGLAAIAFRVLVILQHVALHWVRPIWYFAVVWNLVFLS